MPHLQVKACKTCKHRRQQQKRRRLLCMKRCRPSKDRWQMPRPSLDLTERSDQSTVPAAVSLTCYLRPAARKHNMCLSILRAFVGLLFCSAVLRVDAVEAAVGSFGKIAAQSFRETALHPSCLPVTCCTVLNGPVLSIPLPADSLPVPEY